MSSAIPPTLPAVRRVITGHNPDGKAIVIRDEVQPAKYWSPKSTNPIYDLGRTGTVPAKNDSEILTGEFVDEIAEHSNLVDPNGTTFRTFDTAPGMVVPFHRTISTDYGIVMKGQIVLELDDNERVTLSEGDVVMQRGTIHSWRNESEEWARVMFVVVGAKPIVIQGKELAEEWRLVEPRNESEA